FLFFFSSRRRHTRCYRDWSSDVCSSDLVGAKQRQPLHLNGVLLQNSSELRISSAVGALDRVLAVPLQDASSERFGTGQGHQVRGDRKITRLNSSHGSISYAVFCLKKKIT